MPGSRSWDVTVKKIIAKAGKKESAHTTEKLASDPVITGSKDVIRNDSLPPLLSKDISLNSTFVKNALVLVRISSQND